MINIKKRVKQHIREVIKTKKSPNSIALGFAIGTFIGTLPIPFIDLFIGALILLIFKKINKYSLFAGILLWNPLTKIPIYTLSYSIGDMIYGPSQIVSLELSFLNQILIATRRMIVGNIIISVLLSVISYALVYLIVKLIIKNKTKIKK